MFKAASFPTSKNNPYLKAYCLSDKSLCSFRWAMMFEQIICPSNLEGTQVNDTGR